MNSFDGGPLALVTSFASCLCVCVLVYRVSEQLRAFRRDASWAVGLLAYRLYVCWRF